MAIECVGAARGSSGLAGCLAEGAAAGARAAAACGFAVAEPMAIPPIDAEQEAAPVSPFVLPFSRGARRAFVDLHNDVTAADIALAAREGYAAAEHLKRYTTLGMGADQGKTGNMPGLALLAAATGQSIAATGTTTFRPPCVPVSYGALAGREHGRLADPVRVTPMHEWHVAAGAVFEDVGQWKRARPGGAARRLDARQDRGERPRRRRISRPHLHQPLAEFAHRPLPLRHDVPRRRHGVRRRGRRPPRR